MYVGCRLSRSRASSSRRRCWRIASASPPTRTVAGCRPCRRSASCRPSSAATRPPAAPRSAPGTWEEAPGKKRYPDKNTEKLMVGTSCKQLQGRPTKCKTLVSDVHYISTILTLLAKSAFQPTQRDKGIVEKKDNTKEDDCVVHFMLNGPRVDNGIRGTGKHDRISQPAPVVRGGITRQFLSVMRSVVPRLSSLHVWFLIGIVARCDIRRGVSTDIPIRR